MRFSPLLMLLFFAFATYGQQISVAVLPSDGSVIGNDELEALTDEMRVAALKVLPTNDFVLLKQDVVVKRLGGTENYIKKCKESSCIVDLGKQAQVDYVAQANVSKLGNRIRLKVELYNVRTEGLVGMFNDDADNVIGLLAIVKKKAPEVFSKIKSHSVSITSDPEGADLSFDVVSSRCITPCKVELPASSVRITADLEEYETTDTTISIKQNNQRILIRMRPNFGFLEIKPAYSEGIGKDEQWSLTLNGQSFSSLENKLPADKYNGELSHRCYEDISFNIGVSKGKRQVFDMAKQVKLKKGGLVLKAEKNGEPVFVNGKQVGKTPFSGSVPLCAVVEVGKGRERVDVELEYNGRVEHTHKYEYEILGERGNAYFYEVNYDQAIEDYTAALRIKPDYYIALANRGLAYHKKGNYDRAIEDYTATLRIKPNFQEFLYLRGFAFLLKKNYDRAIEDFNAALRIKPDYLDALSNRGNAYVYKGNYDRAIKDFEAVLKIDPNDVYARNIIEEIRKFTDSRDGKTYKTIKMPDGKIWMAENLNYNASGSKCYDNNPANCQICGRLYNWATAKMACPMGWHLPSDTEWGALITAVGGEKTAGKFLKATSGNGLDSYGFTALSCGSGYSDGIFILGNQGGMWWSNTEYGSIRAYNRSVSNYREDVVRDNFNKDVCLYSVRCVRN